MIESKEYLTELHMHTKESSSCAEISAKDMIDLYNRENYSTIVITDHCSKNKMDRLENFTSKEKVEFIFNGYEIAKEYGTKLGINIICGIEITLYDTDSDYIIYGVDKEFIYKNEKIYMYSLKELYNKCVENGYILVQVHPFRDDIQLAPLEFIDGIEVFNGCQDEISRNDKALNYGNSTNKILTSGSDFHRINDLARGGIITNKKIINSKELVNVLKNKEFRIK